MLCSTALRTRETYERLAAALETAPVLYERRLYAASADDLLELLRTVPDQFSTALVIGHNPGLEQLAALLSSGQSGEFRGMPAGGVAVLKLPAGADLEPGVAELAAFWWP